MSMNRLSRWALFVLLLLVSPWAWRVIGRLLGHPGSMQIESVSLSLTPVEPRLASAWRVVLYARNGEWIATSSTNDLTQPEPMPDAESLDVGPPAPLALPFFRFIFDHPVTTAGDYWLALEPASAQGAPERRAVIPLTEEHWCGAPPSVIEEETGIPGPAIEELRRERHERDPYPSIPGQSDAGKGGGRTE